MIASLEGRVASRRPDHLVIQCAGVGYRLNCSAQTLRSVPAEGEEARVLTHLLLRDDAMHLYGFASEAERDLFLKLVSVAGVGPKMALAVLSASSAADVGRAIAAGDGKRFQVVPGVGKRTAERIIVELREKVGDAEITATSNGSADPRALARDGLVSLGYDVTQAEKMLQAVEGEASHGPEDLIAAALRASVGGRA